MLRKRFLPWMALGVTLTLMGCGPQLSPVADISVNPARGYPPLEVTFDGSGSRGAGAAIVAYRWEFEDGTTSASPTAAHTFRSKGTYEVTLTVTDAEGRIGVAAASIRVLNRIPHANFTITPFGAPRDYPVQFDASSSEDPDGEILSYHWDFGDGTEAEGVHVSHVFPQQQTQYSVTLTVVDDDGVSNSTVRTVVVLGCDTCG